MKKYILILGGLLALQVLAQTKNPGFNWYQKSPSIDTMGVDLFKAYDFLASKKSKEIIVAVMDGGTDITHPDFRCSGL